jgi:hypothetical protein
MLEYEIKAIQKIDRSSYIEFYLKNLACFSNKLPRMPKPRPVLTDISRSSKVNPIIIKKLSKVRPAS